MEDIQTVRTGEILLRNLFLRIGDLINIDGPLLTLFQDQKDASFYLYDWMDSDGVLNRWIIYKVLAEDVINYLSKTITHLDLFLKAERGIYYYTDIDPNKVFEHEIYSLKFLPPNYSQTEGNLFDEEFCKDVQKILLFVSRAKATKDNENFYKASNSIKLGYLSDEQTFSADWIDPKHYDIYMDSGVMILNPQWDKLSPLSSNAISGVASSKFRLNFEQIKSKGTHVRQANRLPSKERMEIYRK